MLTFLLLKRTEFMKEKKEKEFVSTGELAEILGISRIAVFKRIKRGEIKAVKVGRNFVIKKSDLDRRFILKNG